MRDRYEIEVFTYGKELFTAVVEYPSMLTISRDRECTLNDIEKLFRGKFPESEGYQIYIARFEVRYVRNP